MRRGKAKIRTIAPDCRFKDRQVAKFINRIMHKGKKLVAQKVVYGALDRITEKGEEALEIFRSAVENVRPVVAVRSRRVGGATYQVPMDLTRERSEMLAQTWIINAARKGGERTMVGRLSSCLIDASRQKGAAFKKKEDTHRMADANKAFAHFRW